MSEEVSTLTHYDLLIAEGHDPCLDPPELRSYMAGWDGAPFFNALGDLTEKRVLEVGVGTGRVAQQVLARGCATFTGLDISAPTIARACAHLSAYPHARLHVADILDYRNPAAFDVAYSVLTFLHIADKPRALAHMVEALGPGGRLVLSISLDGPWLDYGSRRLRLYPADPADYLPWLYALGCHVAPPTDLHTPDGTRVAVLLVAQKREKSACYVKQ